MAEEPLEDPTQMPVEDLFLSLRTEKCLAREGIRTVADLLKWSEDELLAIRWFVPACLLEIERALDREGGWRLRDSTLDARRDQWRPQPLSALDLPDYIVQSLSAAGFETVGQVAEGTWDMDNPIGSPPLDKASLIVLYYELRRTSL